MGMRQTRATLALALGLAAAAGLTGCGPGVVVKEGGDRGGDNLLATADLKSAPIPDESSTRYPECRKCHPEDRQRYHWR